MSPSLVKRIRLLLFIFSLSCFYLTHVNGRNGNRIRQRSDGCGPHPLIALVSAASRPSGGPNINEVLRAVKADPDVWSEMLVLLRRYDDCVRAGDGLHYKRTPEPVSSIFISDADY